MDSIKGKLTLLLGLLLSLGMMAAIFSGYYQMKLAVLDQEGELYRTLAKFAANEIENLMEVGSASLMMMTANQRVQAAFAQGEREELRELAGSILADSRRFGIEAVQFHLPSGQPFLSVGSQGERPEGLALKVQRTGSAAGGLGKDLVLWVVAPMTHEGTYIGTAAYGMPLGEGFLRGIQDYFPGDYYIHSLDGKISSGTGAEVLRPSPETLARAAKGELAWDEIDQRAAVALPLRDWQGQAVGFIQAVLSREGVLSGLHNAVSKAIWAFILSTVLILLVVRIAIGRLLAPLEWVIAATTRMGQGDLTASLEHVRRQDEVGRLALAFTAMKEGMVKVIGQASRTAAEVAASSGALSGAASATSASVVEVATGANEFAGTVEDLSLSARTMTEAAAQVSQSAQEGNELLQGAIAQMKDAAELVFESNSAILQLEGHSQKIGQIVDLIGAIAEQTNLLALNAAIEAARAGDAGRGFAVVAEEVRELAEQAAQSAKEITGLIRGIQRDTITAVERTEASAASIQGGAGKLELAGRAFQGIVGAIQGVLDRSQGVAVSARSLGATSQEIAAATEEQSASLEEISARIEQLSGVTHELENLLQQFQV
ncbi:MAG: HAMP domain-containing protein [Firmicutes bacterium]|nr:HAMP domain-containing protein [Bacillota bacterium]